MNQMSSRNLKRAASAALFLWGLGLGGFLSIRGSCVSILMVFRVVHSELEILQL